MEKDRQKGEVGGIGPCKCHQITWTVSYISNRFHACGLFTALMMEAVRTSETLVNFYQSTRRYKPEDSHLRAHHRENLKFYYETGVRFSIEHQTNYNPRTKLSFEVVCITKTINPPYEDIAFSGFYSSTVAYTQDGERKAEKSYQGCRH
jgi:hypothetical protein